MAKKLNRTQIKKEIERFEKTTNRRLAGKTLDDLAREFKRGLIGLEIIIAIATSDKNLSQEKAANTFLRVKNSYFIFLRAALSFSIWRNVSGSPFTVPDIHAA